MQVLGNVGLSPASGLSLTLDLVEVGGVDHSTLVFQNGLLAGRTHHPGGGGAAIDGLTFLDSVTGKYVTMSFADGQVVYEISDTPPASPIDSISFKDTVTGNTVVVSFADGQIQYDIEN